MAAQAVGPVLAQVLGVLHPPGTAEVSAHSCGAPGERVLTHVRDVRFLAHPGEAPPSAAEPSAAEPSAAEPSAAEPSAAKRRRAKRRRAMHIDLMAVVVAVDPPLNDVEGWDNMEAWERFLRQCRQWEALSGVGAE